MKEIWIIGLIISLGSPNYKERDAAEKRLLQEVNIYNIHYVRQIGSQSGNSEIVNRCFKINYTYANKLMENFGDTLPYLAMHPKFYSDKMYSRYLHGLPDDANFGDNYRTATHYWLMEEIERGVRIEDLKIDIMNMRLAENEYTIWRMNNYDGP